MVVTARIARESLYTGKTVKVATCTIEVTRSVMDELDAHDRATAREIIAYLRDDAPVSLAVAAGESGFSFTLPIKDGKYVHPLTSEQWNVVSDDMPNPAIRLNVVLKTEARHVGELQKLIDEKKGDLLPIIHKLASQHGVTVIMNVQVQAG